MFKEIEKEKEYENMPREEQQFLTIGEFAKAIGVSEKTLRRWDQKDILKPHHKTPGGRRIYTSQQVQDYFAS